MVKQSRGSLYGEPTTGHKGSKAVLELRARLRRSLAQERYPLDPGSRGAAVVLALTDEADARLLLIRRSLALPLNPGELAFPGGKSEVSDPDLYTTALREAEEEVALPPGCFDFCGSLPHRTTLSGISVVGMVGVIPPDLVLVAEPGEVSALVYVPLARFAAPGALQVDRLWSKGEPKLLARYELGDCMVWGMTAGLIVELVNRLYDADLPEGIYR
jgi:8-oxo-dGTP pyrophosphatase MutT (NUDIX family)